MAVHHFLFFKTCQVERISLATSAVRETSCISTSSLPQNNCHDNHPMSRYFRNLANNCLRFPEGCPPHFDPFTLAKPPLAPAFSFRAFRAAASSFRFLQHASPLSATQRHISAVMPGNGQIDIANHMRYAEQPLKFPDSRSSNPFMSPE